MRTPSTHAGYNESWSDSLRRFVRPNEAYLKHHLWNCGAVGGARGAFLAALANALADDARALGRNPNVQEAGLDMLVWNEVDLAARGITAADHGLPARASQPADQRLRPWAQVRKCPGACRLGFINATAGKYWFTHKPPSSWLALSDVVAVPGAEDPESTPIKRLPRYRV